MESRSIWPQGDLMFVSVGTGSAPGRSLLGNLKELAQRLSEIALDTEQTNRDFRAENPELIRNGRMYRFNVTDGSMANIGIEEYQAAAKIAAYTNSHLDDPDVAESVESCVQNLRSGGQRLGYASLEGSNCPWSLVMLFAHARRYQSLKSWWQPRNLEKWLHHYARAAWEVRFNRY